MADADQEHDRRWYERAFRRAGLPLLIEDYSAREDIFTRAIPLLGFLFLLEILAPLQDGWPWWANALAVTVAMAVLLGGVAVLNVRQGRPAVSVPRRIGTPELVAFVLLPAVVGAAAGLADGLVVERFVVAVVVNLLILGLVWVVVGLGLISIVGWALRRFLGELLGSLSLLTRAAPLLLFFALVLLLTNEMWQVFGELTDNGSGFIGLFFLGFAALFISLRIPGEVAKIESEVSPDLPLSTLQRLNVGLVMFVSHGLQVLVVSAAVAVFFIIFGALAIKPSVQTGWLGHPPQELFGWTMSGRRHAVTAELVRVSVAIAAFSGLYYALTVLTDQQYRREFLAELETAMRRTFTLRAEYLRRWFAPVP